MATCRTAAIAAGADPVDRREAGLLEKESGSFWFMEFRGGVMSWFMVCHVRHRVFDVIHEFRCGSWGGS